MSTSRCLLAGSAVAVLLVAGCSSGGSETAVASLSEDAGVAAASEGEAELTEEAALEFAQCMRDNGVDDFADPTVDADGNVTLGGGPGAGGGAGDVDREAMAAARETCGDLIEGAAFGGGRGGGLGDDTELQDALVGYTACLRDEGLDVGDFEFGGGPGAGGGQEEGAGGPPAGAGGQRGQGGEGQGPGGFVANALGLDTDDPEVAAATEECQPLLDEAFTGFGPGAQGN